MPLVERTIIQVGLAVFLIIVVYLSIRRAYEGRRFPPPPFQRSALFALYFFCALTIVLLTLDAVAVLVR